MCPLAPPPNDASIAKRLLLIFFVCHLQYLAQVSSHGLRFVDLGYRALSSLIAVHAMKMLRPFFTAHLVVCEANSDTLRVDMDQSDVGQ